MATSTVATALGPMMIRLSGPSIGKTYPLKSISEILLCIDELLENSYYVLADAQHWPRRWSRRQIDVVAGFPEKGSIVFPVEIQLALAATMSSHITPRQILDLGKETLEMFLKILGALGGSKKPSKPPISIVGDHNNVTIIQGDVKVTGSRHAADVITRSYPGLTKLLGKFDGEHIQQMELEGGTGANLHITPSNRERLLSFPKPLRDEIVRLLKEKQATEEVPSSSSALEKSPGEELEGSGDIIAFNKKDRTGIINLVTARGTSPGLYEFEIRSQEATANVIVAMLQSRVRIRFKIEVVRTKTWLGIIWIEKELGSGAV